MRARWSVPVSGAVDTTVFPQRPPGRVPLFRVLFRGDGSGPAHELTAVARALHDGVSQALFRAELALSDLAERAAPGSVEADLADEALEAVKAAVIETRQEIDRLRTWSRPDGH